MIITRKLGGNLTKKKKFIILILLTAMLIIIGRKCYIYKRLVKYEVVKILKSKAAEVVLEETLKKLDPKALTSEGIINSYEIDFDSIDHELNGGIIVDLIINNDRKLKVYDTIEKSKSNGDIKADISGYSLETANLLNAIEK